MLLNPPRQGKENAAFRRLSMGGFKAMERRMASFLGLTKNPRDDGRRRPVLDLLG